MYKWLNWKRKCKKCKSLSCYCYVWIHVWFADFHVIVTCEYMCGSLIFMLLLRVNTCVVRWFSCYCYLWIHVWFADFHVIVTCEYMCGSLIFMLLLCVNTCVVRWFSCYCYVWIHVCFADFHVIVTCEYMCGLLIFMLLLRVNTCVVRWFSCYCYVWIHVWFADFLNSSVYIQSMFLMTLMFSLVVIYTIVQSEEAFFDHYPCVLSRHCVKHVKIYKWFLHRQIGRKKEAQWNRVNHRR